MEESCETCRILEQPSYLLIRTTYWNVALSKNHAYPGRAYVSLLKHKSTLSELSEEEWDDFRQLVYKLENAYQKALGAGPINWACLTNNAYKKKPYNPHVHWHLIPRYEKPVIIQGTVLIDKEFGHMFTPKKERIVDNRTVRELAKKIKVFL